MWSDELTRRFRAAMRFRPRTSNRKEAEGVAGETLTLSSCTQLMLTAVPRSTQQPSIFDWGSGAARVVGECTGVIGYLVEHHGTQDQRNSAKLGLVTVSRSSSGGGSVWDAVSAVFTVIHDTDMYNIVIKVNNGAEPVVCCTSMMKNAWFGFWFGSVSELLQSGLGSGLQSVRLAPAVYWI